MKAATILALAALLACGMAQQPIPDEQVQYEVSFSMSWQNVDNIFATVLGAQEPLTECPKVAPAEDCQRATLIFSAEQQSEGSITELELEVEVPQEPVEVPEPTVAAEPEPEPEQEYDTDIATPTVKQLTPTAHELPESDTQMMCRAVIELVDTTCEPNLCSDACREAAQKAVSVMKVCRKLSIGLAMSSCGVHPQTFGMELEIVARKHDCECAHRCPKGGSKAIRNPYCDQEEATIDALTAHRVTRTALLLASFFYIFIWMLVWRRYCMYVEGRYAEAGRPMGRCHRSVFRILALPLTACMTQFGLCLMAMMPPMAFITFILFIILLRRNRRRRMAHLAARRSVDHEAQRTELMMVLESGHAVQFDPVALKEAEEDARAVVVGEVVENDDAVVLAVPEQDGAEVVVGEVVAEPEIMVADVVESNGDVMVADIVD